MLTQATCWRCCLWLLVALLPAHVLADESDVARSWNAAVVYTPGDPNPKRPEDLTGDRKQPVVLYMHGCGGINEENDLPWIRYVANLGFVVVAPDRFARANKAPSCWPDRVANILEMRQEELGYALVRLKASRWADTANIFVMAFSEGADTVAESRFDGVRGVILSSWTCGRVKQFAIPDGVPVLSVMWDEAARWHFWPKQTCADDFAGRAGFQNLALHGQGHATYAEVSARQAVAQFLRHHLANRSATRD